MKNLESLQNQFIDAIYGAKNAKFFNQIKTSKSSKEELVNIYRNNMRVTLSNVLKITYPLVLQKIGTKKFEEFSQEFISKNRSQSNNLDEFGEEFADFFAAKNEEFLHDLAALEWLKQKSYLAKDSTFLDVFALQNLASEKLFDIRFELQPSCFLRVSNFNLLNKNKLNKKQTKKIYFLIFRQNLETRVEKISKDEFNFLSGVKENLTLYEIFEKYQIDIQNCLQKFATNGVLIRFF